MNDRHEMHVTCEGCGETFQHFLDEMSEHNEQVTCPSCGAAHDPARLHNPISPEKL